jgi:hypothetical protein
MDHVAISSLRLNIAALAATAVAAAALSAPAVADSLHGYCSGSGQCIDMGTNSPTSNNPPTDFGFTVASGPTAGDLVIKILTPDNMTAGPSFALTGTVSATATLLAQSPWTGGDLATFLGISASPNNPLGAFLPATQALDPGAMGFNVYEADLGPMTLQSPSNPNVSPLENIAAGVLPKGSYIVGFFNEGNATAPDWVATANSGAIFETGGGTSVPEPATLGLLGPMLIGVALALRAHRRRQH